MDVCGCWPHLARTTLGNDGALGKKTAAGSGLWGAPGTHSSTGPRGQVFVGAAGNCGGLAVRTTTGASFWNPSSAHRGTTAGLTGSEMFSDLVPKMVGHAPWGAPHIRHIVQPAPSSPQPPDHIPPRAMATAGYPPPFHCHPIPIPRQSGATVTARGCHCQGASIRIRRAKNSTAGAFTTPSHALHSGPHSCCKQYHRPPPPNTHCTAHWVYCTGTQPASMEAPSKRKQHISKAGET